MKLKTGLVLVLSLVVAVAYAAAQQTGADGKHNGGADQLELEGGSLGPVNLPHALHQQSLGDCETCHQLYPQERGAINRLEKSGELRNQQVMNNQCIGCHRKNEAAGKPSGPTQCNACHKK